MLLEQESKQLDLRRVASVEVKRRASMRLNFPKYRPGCVAVFRIDGEHETTSRICALHEKRGGAKVEARWIRCGIGNGCAQVGETDFVNA